MIRILHLSDLHVSLADREDRARIVTALLKDAKSFAVEMPIDLAVFSGDLAKEGLPEEFALGKELLLDPLISDLGVAPEKVVLVPGNHDVDRHAIRDLVEHGLASTLTEESAVDKLGMSERDLVDALERLRAWDEFCAESGLGGSPHPARSVAFPSSFELSGLKISIVALNSAWRSSGSGDKGALLVGATATEHALEEVEKADVKIVVMHHPLEWLQGFDADRLRNLFEVHNAIVLQGHEHDPDPHATKSPRGEALYLQTGCLYQSREYPNSYFLIDIDPDDGKVIVRVRRWSERTGSFDAATEVVKGGVTEFPLPGGGPAADLGHPPFSEVMRAIAHAATELRVLPEDMSTVNAEARAVEEVLVRPRFLSVPFTEARAMATLDNGVEPYELDPVAELAEHDVLIVAGDAQAGVSSSLLWTLSGSYRSDAARMPAYLAAKDSKLGIAQQHGTLAKAASLFGHRQTDSRDPDLLLAVDNVGPENERKLERLAAFISTNSRHRYVLGVRSNDALPVASALEKAGVASKTVHLAPFGRTQLRTLMQTIRSVPHTDVERIYGLIQAQNLPSTPFTMVALISVMVTGQGLSGDLNQSSLLDAFVNVLLGGGELTDLEHLGMDYRKRVHLLGEFARRLYDTPRQTLPVPEAERMLLDYFQRKALRLSAGAVLSSLVERHVLVIEDDEIGFRSEALYHLFLGRWMLESPEQKAEMLAEPARNSVAIVHAAGLQRSDRELLASVGEFSRGVITTLAHRLPRAEVDNLLEQYDAPEALDLKGLEKALAELPERQTEAELDAQLDRLSEALGGDGDLPSNAALEVLAEVEAATQLLSNVLRNSELVDDIALKRELMELAIEGWVLVMGAMLAEDVGGDSIRQLIAEVAGAELADEKHAEVLTRVVLLVLVLISAGIAAGSLGSRHLATTLESCLEDSSFSESETACALAVWIEATLAMPEWPRRLDTLLMRLNPRSFLRNATVALAVAAYRSTDDEAAAAKVLAVLRERLAPAVQPGQMASMALTAEKERIAHSLIQSRRRYQGIAANADDSRQLST